MYIDFTGKYLRTDVGVTLNVEAADLQYSPKVLKSSGIQLPEVWDEWNLGYLVAFSCNTESEEPLQKDIVQYCSWSLSLIWHLHKLKSCETSGHGLCITLCKMKLILDFRLMAKGNCAWIKECIDSSFCTWWGKLSLWVIWKNLDTCLYEVQT